MALDEGIYTDDGNSFSGLAYGASPYAGYLFGADLIKIDEHQFKGEFFFFLGPNIGARLEAPAAGRIFGQTFVTGYLLGGTYIPPPPPPTDDQLEGFIDITTDVRGTLSGGRAVLALQGRVAGHTFVKARLSGGSIKEPIFLESDHIDGSSIVLGVMDGGEEALIIELGTVVTGDMSGGVATRDLIQLRGYPIICRTSVFGTLDGGTAVTELAGDVYGSTDVYASMKGGRNPGPVHLSGRVFCQPVISGTLTGGGTYQPPPPPPPGTGGVVFSGTIRIKGVVSVNADATTIPVDFVPGEPTDMPDDSETPIIAAPRIELLESVGFGAQGPASEIVLDPNQYVNLTGEDVHTGGYNNNYPILPNNDGSPSYSYERWVRVRFTPPFGIVKHFRFWAELAPITFGATPTAGISEGWNVMWGWSNTYQTPTNAPSQIAVNPIPQVDPGSPNIGIDLELPGGSTQYTPYIVIQAYYIPNETVLDVLAPPPGLSYNIRFVQA